MAEMPLRMGKHCQEHLERPVQAVSLLASLGLAS
jgi:hypothetical protein